MSAEEWKEIYKLQRTKQTVKKQKAKYCVCCLQKQASQAMKAEFLGMDHNQRLVMEAEGPELLVVKANQVIKSRTAVGGPLPAGDGTRSHSL